MPVNWSAYEDIADFFTNDVKEIDGQKVYGHMDYGKKDPSLGWRFTDAWLSMAGNGDNGLPNGKPVDEWGIRMEDGIPRGSSISRGGDANGPAAVYATTKFVEWLKKYAPPEASGMDFLEAGAVPGPGPYRAADLLVQRVHPCLYRSPSLPVMNADGTPKWRMAPSPHGAYWKEGMKLGYQDVGCWTMLKYAPLERVKAGWLYAQFCVSKTVTLKKSVKSLHLIRESDIWARRDDGACAQGRRPRRVLPQPRAQAVDADWRQRAGIRQAGAGLVAERLARRSPARRRRSRRWTVWRAIRTPSWTRLEKSGVQGKLGPKMNEEKDPEYWYAKAEKDGNVAPQRKLANEKPQGVTIDYDELLKTWKATPAQGLRRRRQGSRATPGSRLARPAARRSCQRIRANGDERRGAAPSQDELDAGPDRGLGAGTAGHARRHRCRQRRDRRAGGGHMGLPVSAAAAAADPDALHGSGIDGAAWDRHRARLWRTGPRAVRSGLGVAVAGRPRRRRDRLAGDGIHRRAELANSTGFRAP